MEHAPSASRRARLRAAAVLAVILAFTAWARLRKPILTFEGPAEFVGRSVCAECHRREDERWRGSHHDLAMDHATAATVLANFEDTAFERHGVISRFARRDGRFFVRTEGSDGALEEFEVQYVFGVEPLQQYLVAGPRGRLQVLPLCWDTRAQRWFHLHDERIAHDDPLHWTGPQFNWNYMCAECHSTNLQRGYDPAADSYHTTWSEIDVSCEACHGPGSHHQTWARQGADARVASRGLEVRFKGRPARVEVDRCGGCHARREPLGRLQASSGPLMDRYAPGLLVEPLYYPDGQILDEVYVYGSFLQSRMHAAGVRCTDCHDPHSARLAREGDSVCTKCHCEEGDERFPTLRKAKYDDVKHHFHADGRKPGTACVDCHMPARTYMQIDSRRDHSFRVPRPDLTEKLGVPNPCNTCHGDRTPAWCVAEIGKRLPDFLTGRVATPHFSEAFSTARTGSTASFPALAQIATDTGFAPIVRATAVEYLARSASPESLRAILPAIDDADGLVRATAASAVARRVPAWAPRRLLLQKSRVLAPLLVDPLRLVRVEAARALAGGAEALLDHASQGAFEAAFRELEERYESQAERPEAHLTLGALHEARRRPEEAERSYRRALVLDPGFLPARFNLATLYNGLHRNDEAARELRTILAAEPDHGEAWYSLGLLRAEMGDNAGATQALARAVERLPARARVQYNYGVALLRGGRVVPADAALSEAHRLDPADPDVLRALIGLCRQQGQEARARALEEEVPAR